MVSVGARNQSDLLFSPVGRLRGRDLETPAYPGKASNVLRFGDRNLLHSISPVFSGQSRYHFPVMPFVIAYVAWIRNEMLNSKKRVAALAALPGA
ncbi:hypothetical protein [Nitrosospira sp. Nsp11]|uniref:hypothetical protein n=1 Tax=Nitrosospira sp. Nsp11 TaxID=1855338 RepID=UPI00093262A7|nr:hypothetical protein [Nitrosospira sp. Nsp11]